MEQMTIRRGGALWRWWIAYGLFIAYMFLPGPDRSPFSGIPMALKTQALFFGMVLIGLFSLFFPPTQLARRRWLAILGGAVIVKLVLMMAVVDVGWKGEYWSIKTWRRAETTLVRMPFSQRHGVRPGRLDPAIDFTAKSFALHFLNDPTPKRPDGKSWSSEAPISPRASGFPFRVQWTGHAAGTLRFDPLITANGLVTIDVDGRRVYLGRDPRGERVSITLNSPTQKIRIVYSKPARTEPAISVVPSPGFVVTPEPSNAAGVERSRLLARAIVVIGMLMFVLLIIVFMEAHRPVSRLLVDSLWERPARLATLAFVAMFLIVGLSRSIPFRQVTHELAQGDDFTTYEGNARQILHNGILMVDRNGAGGPYYHYPLYPYVLAGAHAILGEDFSTVLLLNFLCIASLGPIFWLVLRRRIADGATIAILILLALFALKNLTTYAQTSFSDNLYLPVVLATVALLIEAFERPGTLRFFGVGVLTALGAATRPSFLILVPFVVLALLLERRLGSLMQRARLIVSYVAGFLAGVSPFTLRNWIVTRTFVLLVSSFVMLPYFLYAPGEPVPNLFIKDRPPGLGQSLMQFVEIVEARPLKVVSVELRKIAFTLGLTSFGPAGNPSPRSLFVIPLAFGVALWTRRIPWQVRNALLTFLVSHLAAVVIATPWTYGYKTILPFHAVMLIGIAFLLPNWGAVTPRVVTNPKRNAAERPLVSVVLPTYNEKDSIRGVIEDFFATGVVDEVIVVNNNAAPGTSEEVQGTGAREVFEPVQGYGAACQRGLTEAKGDYIVLCEPDGTFMAEDIFKLLAYANDFDAVYGSRTSQQFVWQGANMGFFLRFGNWAVAKYMEFMFNGPNLTDVGCTMRLIKRDVARALAATYTIHGSQFGPEMMVLTLRERYQMVQIPVNYRPRVGVSSVTGDPAKTIRLGLQMIWLITAYRLQHLNVAPAAPDAGRTDPAA